MKPHSWLPPLCWNWQVSIVLQMCWLCVWETKTQQLQCQPGHLNHGEPSLAASSWLSLRSVKNKSEQSLNEQLNYLNFTTELFKGKLITLDQISVTPPLPSPNQLSHQLTPPHTCSMSRISFSMREFCLCFPIPLCKTVGAWEEEHRKKWWRLTEERKEEWMPVAEFVRGKMAKRWDSRLSFMAVTLCRFWSEPAERHVRQASSGS